MYCRRSATADRGWGAKMKNIMLYNSGIPQHDGLDVTCKTIAMAPGTPPPSARVPAFRKVAIIPMVGGLSPESYLYIKRAVQFPPNNSKKIF